MSIAADVHQTLGHPKAENEIQLHTFFFHFLHVYVSMNFAPFSSGPVVCSSFSKPSCKRSLSHFRRMFYFQFSLAIELLLLMLISSYISSILRVHYFLVVAHAFAAT